MIHPKKNTLKMTKHAESKAKHWKSEPAKLLCIVHDHNWSKDGRGPIKPLKIKNGTQTVPVKNK